MQMAVPAQRGAQRLGGLTDIAAFGRLQAAEIDRHLTGQRFDDASSRDVTDAGQLG
jgi:hypothetical protein